ncbi:MAG: MmgE/PrpD family protein [Syntrophaceae bacterium]|nr:MmgE/PrpD family protein [Syntrophaceae bacterium]
MSKKEDSSIALCLAQLIQRMRSTRVSVQDRRIVRQHMLDAIASAFVGIRNKVFQDLTQLCPKVTEGRGWPASRPNRVTALDAGMLWAFAINASVFEDGSREGACHPAAAVLPTVMALSEKKSWETIDQAVMAGYDVMVRLARSGNPEFTRRGFHPTAITASYGAAATASLLLGFDLSTSQNALCLAALCSAGLMASFMRGETQPLQVAWSVRSGIAAAMMAGAGHLGYDRIIEEGFYPAYLGAQPTLPVGQSLEFEYAIQGCYLKPYPGCRHVHPSIDAFSEILKRNNIQASQIKKIRVRTYKVAVETEIHSLNKRGDAYFNIPYALAVRLILGRNDWDAFDEKHFKNEQILKLMRKVKVNVDPQIESQYPNLRGAIVEVEMEKGKTCYGEIHHPLGEPENPLPFSMTQEKFRQAAKSFLAKESMDRIETILDVSGLKDSPEILLKTLSENKIED